MREFRGVYFECATCVAGRELRKGRTTKQIDAFLKRCGYLWIRRAAIAEARRRLRAKRVKLDDDLKSRGRATPLRSEPSDGERVTSPDDAAVIA
jgi:hypothetical protein